MLSSYLKVDIESGSLLDPIVPVFFLWYSEVVGFEAPLGYPNVELISVCLWGPSCSLKSPERLATPGREVVWFINVEPVGGRLLGYLD